jgi:hypothetical protein
MNKQANLETAAHAVNRKLPKGSQGEIQLNENRARIDLPAGMPVGIHTMMDIAATCLVWGCTAYVQRMTTRDVLSIVFYYEDQE